MRSAPIATTDTEKDEDKRAKDFVKHVSEESYESHFVIWNKTKHAAIYNMVCHQCDELLDEIASKTE